MKSFTTSEIGRVVVMHLGKGDLLLESIQQEAERQDIKNAVILCGIGSMRKLVFHVITSTDDVSTDSFKTLEEPMEIGAIQGLIIDGKPHFHIICSDPKNTYVGHLEPGTEIQYLAEICLMEVKGVDLVRKVDQFGIGYIDER